MSPNLFVCSYAYNDTGIALARLTCNLDHTNQPRGLGHATKTLKSPNPNPTMTRRLTTLNFAVPQTQSVAGGEEGRANKEGAICEETKL